MTEDDRKELDKHLDVCRSLQDVTFSRVRNAAWDAAWLDAVRCANALLEKAAKE